MNDDPKLERLISNFSDVYFNLGGWAFDSEQNTDELKRVLDVYRKSREEYSGDTTVYDNLINASLKIYPDLKDIPRL